MSRKNTVIAMHPPPAIPLHWQDYAFKRGLKDYFIAIQKYGKKQPELGIPYILSGGAGAPLEKGQHTPYFTKRNILHFIEFVVTNKDIQVPIAWKVIDKKIGKIIKVPSDI